jgi:hypothetical protein
MRLVISVLRDYLEIEKIKLEQLLFERLHFRVADYSPSIYKNEPDIAHKAPFRSGQAVAMREKSEKCLARQTRNDQLTEKGSTTLDAAQLPRPLSWVMVTVMVTAWSKGPKSFEVFDLSDVSYIFVLTPRPSNVTACLPPSA